VLHAMGGAYGARGRKCRCNRRKHRVAPPKSRLRIVMPGFCGEKGLRGMARNAGARPPSRESGAQVAAMRNQSGFALSRE
jgi:hypothetical protein